MAVHQTRGGIARAEFDFALGVQLRAVRLAVVSHRVRLSDDPDLLILVLAVAAPCDLQAAIHARDGLVLVVHHGASLVGDGHVGNDVVVVRAVRNVRYGAFHRRRHLVAGRQGCEFARRHGVVHAVIVHGVAAVGMRLAVVLPGVAVRGDGDGLLVLSDLQRAGHVGDNIVRGYVVVVFVNDDRGLRHKPILVHANHGLAAVDGNRLHLVAVREVFRRVAGADLDLTRGVQLRAVRLAVVEDGVVRGGDLHKFLLVQTAFGDGQLAILHDEGYRREVTVPVHEAVLREVHEVVARVRALSVRRRAVGKAEVRFRVQRVADAHDLVAVHLMLLAVVFNRVLVAPDLHDHFGLHGRNRQLAGGRGDGVVLGNVHVVLIENLHRAGERAYVLALIRALGCVGQTFIPVTGLQTSNRDAGDGLLAAVVHLRIAFAREGHGEARVGDGQLAGGLGNVVVLRYVVALSVLNNHVAAERAVVAANILAFRLIGQAFVSVTLHKAALRDAGNALHAAGIGEGLAFAGEGHAARGNGQRALPALGEGVARGHVGFAAHDYVARYHVVAAADVGLAALDNRGQNVALHQRARVGEAVIRQRRAVVNLLVAVRGDGNGLALTLALRDGQLALFLGDGIVRLLEVRAFGVGDRVGHFAVIHEGYAAGGLDIGHLAVHKAVAAHGDNRLRQRRAVVFLARRLGLQRHGALVDGQLAVDGISEGVVLRHVRFAALDRVALNDVPAFVAHVRGAALDDRGQLVAVRQHALGEGEAVIRQRGSVVGLAGAVRGDGNQLPGNRVDHQLAVVRRGDDVPSGLIHRADGILDEVRRVLARVDALRANGDGGEVRRDRLIGLILVFALDGEAVHLLLRAIVGIGFTVRGQLYVLIVVELDHVFALIRADGQLPGIRAHGRIAFNRGGLLGDLRADPGGELLLFVRLHGGIVVPVIANDVLIGVVQLVVVALDILVPIAELDVRDVGQAAVGVARVGVLNVLGRNGVPRVHEHGSARRDGGDCRRVPVLAYRVVGAVLNFRHAVGYNDVRGFVPAHVLHGDLVFDYIANGVVGLYGRGFLPGINRIVARDGQGAVDLLNRVVGRHVAIGVGDLRGGNLRDRLIHADQRLRALAVIQHVCVQGVARQQTSVVVRRFNGVARHVVCRMRRGVRVVVGILQPFSGNLHEALVDDQLAVVHDELDVREVLAGVLEVAFLQTHLVLVRVGARRLGGASKLEVVYRVQSGVFTIDLDAVDLVAINAVFAAVVRHGIRAARDRHDHFGRVSRNRQLAGGLGDGVVLGNVNVVLIENLHRAGERAYVLALIRALGCVGQTFIPVTGLQTSNRDAGDGLLAAVVHLRIAFAREGHGEARVGDGQLAGGLGNVVVLRYVVALSVLNNHVAAERAVVAANILAFRLIGQAFVSVTLHKAALRDAGNALHAAGIGEGLAFAGEGHAARGNGQRALHAVGEGVARGHVGFAAHDLVARYHVVADADVRPAALDNRGQNIAFHQRAHVSEAVIRQRRAVVNLLAAVRGDGNGLALALAPGDGQLAFVLGDGIVRLLEARAFGVGDRVGHFTLVHEGHAAGGHDAGHLARHKAVAGHGNIRLRQRRAVVFLARRLGGQRHGALVDGQLAVDGISEGVVPGHVHVAAHDLVALNDVLAFVAHVRGAALDDRRQHVAFHQHAFGEGEAAIRQRGSVVGLAGAVRGDGDRVFRDRVDLQNAVHDHERYVLEVRVRVLEVARGDAHGVFARVRALRSPRGRFRRLDARGHVVQLIVRRHGLVALDAVLGAVVGNDRAVLGDGNGNLVGHGGDRHIAVVHCLDGHVVVGAGDGEGVHGQTHVRCANVRAPGDGEYSGLEADRNLVRLAGEAVVVAVRLVLLAVVHMRFIDARDGDGGRSLVDGQRAGFIGYIIIGRNFVAVVFDGIRINHVRGIARVGDGGGRRHGEGEVLLRVAVDQTLHCEIGLGQRLAVVGLIRAPGGDGQGHGVIDRDDVAGRIDRDLLRGGISDHLGGGIGGIERIAPVRRQRFADGLGAGLVVGNLDGGAVQVMMDGVARGVELEVQLQHQRTVACDVAGKHVVLVIRFEHVLVVFLSRLIGFGHGNGRVRGGRALVAVVERVSAIDVLIVELDGVLGVGVRRPDGVEDVRAVVVYLHLRVGGDGAFAIGVGVPALEGVAVAGEGSAGSGGDSRVVGEVFNHVLACAAIGLIGQGCASGTRAPLGGEGDDVLFISVIALDLILIAGLVGGRAVSPAEEVLSIISNQLARGHEVSKAVLRVGLAIHRSGYVVLAGNIFYSEGAVLGVVGVEGDIRCDLGLGVEGLAGAVLAGTPAAPGIAFANLRHDFRLLFVQRGFNRVALRDAECNR